MLPSLHITIMAIIIIYLLVKWRKQLETRRFTIFLYFLVSSWIIPVVSVVSVGMADHVAQIWFPVGFVVILFYLRHDEKYHSAKMKASALGFCVALYQVIGQFITDFGSYFTLFF